MSKFSTTVLVVVVVCLAGVLDRANANEWYMQLSKLAMQLKEWESGGVQCDNNAIQLFGKIRDLQSTKYWNYLRNFEGHMENLSDTCEAYILRSLEKQKQAFSSDPRLAKLVQVISPEKVLGRKGGHRRPWDDYVAVEPFKIVDPAQTAKILEQLVPPEPTPDPEDEEVVEKPTKEELFKEHLFEPCQEVLSKTETLFDGLKSILNQQYRSYEFSKLRSLAFTDLACRTITTMSPRDTKKMFKKLSI